MYEIVINDQQDLIEVSLERIEAIVRDVLTHERVTGAEVSIALIDGRTMRRLNNTHLGHDYDTDVLSFLLESSPQETSGEIPRGAGKRIEGEILLSTQIALQAARDYNWDVEHEVALYVVHGLLHLLGYDDLTDEESKLMRSRECLHLSRWNLVPPGRSDAAIVD